VSEGKRIIIPLLTVIIGYMIIIIFFAGIFGSIYKYELSKQISAKSFEGSGLSKIENKNPFVDFFYYSLVTITTLGYGDIYPTKRWTKLLVSLETVLGISWFAVGIALSLEFLKRSNGKYG
jgi:voltage-gated potassium channel Kch